MANYHSWLVTDGRFRVKDPEKFRGKLGELGIRDADRCDYYGLCFHEEKDGSFWLGGYEADLTKLISDPDGDLVSIDIAEIVRDHLEKGETAVFKCIGQEKLRGVSGYVVVVKPYGVESMTLAKTARTLKEKMNPLRQGVKSAVKNEGGD